MDNRLPSNSEEFHLAPPDYRSPPNQVKTESRHGSELKDRKLQKADREKLRRDRLNEQFNELGKTLDPERPKNDKATILGDTIQILNDLTAQISKLKSEYATLTEESRELTQEKHDLREEKASLKSDIDNLNRQYQQRITPMYPYPVLMPPGAIPMPPGAMPYPFFGNQNPTCTSFFQSVQYVSPGQQLSSGSHVSSREGSRNKSLEKDEGSDDVATELELKIPGFSEDQDDSLSQLKSKKLHKKENNISNESSPSECSSSRTVQVSSSNSVIDSTNGDH